ncbi:hypothetical protein GOP47_0024459 [Adiantum capillus-veneris]|uniref:Uncharacterized protein n=1 Tax=Adiantum capillus-veneris TaxID=13818 RepID=A0A9D4Z3P8_ADICA|nr:hypothetical protein GOP47_0024459 [Adiantum capillus-veneris]
MAQHKFLKLAFLSRSFASRLKSPSLEHLVNLHIHRVLASSYSTASEDGRNKAFYNQIMKISCENPRNTKLLVLAGGFVTIVGGYFIYHSKERVGPVQAKRPARRETLVEHKATIGGPFSLINHKGQVGTDRDLRGHWTLIYFGYTSCPDDCPEELQKLANAVNCIQEQTGEKVTSIFITVDPKRDTPAQLQAYLSEFHPRFMGLTGSVDDIRQVAREYRVFYKRVEDEGSDYLVEHSNLVYLMDPDMEFVKFFGKEYDDKRLCLGVIEEMKKLTSTVNITAGNCFQTLKSAATQLQSTNINKEILSQQAPR